MASDCSICGGRGILSDGGKCKCLLVRELRELLPPYLREVKLSEHTIKNPDNYYKIGDMLWVIDREGYFSRLKTYLYMSYLVKRGEFRFRLLTGTELMDLYNTVGLQEVCELNFVVFELGGDPYNKAFFSAFTYVTSQRRKFGGVTWVYVHPSEVSRFAANYGADGRELYALVFESGLWQRMGK